MEEISLNASKPRNLTCREKIAGYPFACKGNYHYCFISELKAKNPLFLDFMFCGWNSKVPYYYQHYQVYTDGSYPPQDKYWTILLEASYLAKDNEKPEQVLSTTYLVTLQFL